MDFDAKKPGIKTAIAELHDPAAPVPGSEVEQLALLPLDKAIEANNVQAPGPRGPGRPPGAKNKNTEAWREYFLGKYRSPLEVLFQTFSMPLDDLRTIIGGSKADAFKIQLQAAKEAAPYVHQKMPMAIEAGEGGLIQLSINTGAAQAQGVQNAGPTAIKILNSKDEEYQPLIDGEILNSNETTSNDFLDVPENADEKNEKTD
jgi:hypothetical protein